MAQTAELFSPKTLILSVPDFKRMLNLSPQVREVSLVAFQQMLRELLDESRTTTMPISLDTQKYRSELLPLASERVLQVIAQALIQDLADIDEVILVAGESGAYLAR